MPRDASTHTHAARALHVLGAQLARDATLLRLIARAALTEAERLERMATQHRRDASRLDRRGDKPGSRNGGPPSHTPAKIGVTRRSRVRS